MAIKWLDTFFNVEDAWILWINFISAAYDDDNGHRFLYQKKIDHAPIVILLNSLIIISHRHSR